MPSVRNRASAPLNHGITFNEFVPWQQPLSGFFRRMSLFCTQLSKLARVRAARETGAHCQQRDVAGEGAWIICVFV
jgi:hypothetical protein